MRKSKVLVTGGRGYVGSRLVPHLIKNGHHVSVLDLGLYNKEGSPVAEKNLDFFCGDIRDPDLVKRAVVGVDSIIHLAAISNDPTGEVDATLTRQVNFDAVGLLLSVAKEAGVRRFINASSSSVFGIKDAPNATEDLEPEPLTSYSKYKMLSEWLVRSAASNNFVTVSIRPATICGPSPRQRFDLTVNKLTLDAVTKRVITVHGGNQRRPNVGIADVIELYSMLLEIEPSKIQGKIFNFGFENLKVIEIAKLIQNQLSDLDVKIEITDSFDNRDYHISADKIKKELNYSPISSISKEVENLRRSILEGQFPDLNSNLYYNMKAMKLERDFRPYAFLSR